MKQRVTSERPIVHLTQTTGFWYWIQGETHRLFENSEQIEAAFRNVSHSRSSECDCAFKRVLHMELSVSDEIREPPGVFWWIGPSRSTHILDNICRGAIHRELSHHDNAKGYQCHIGTKAFINISASRWTSPHTSWHSPSQRVLVCSIEICCCAHGSCSRPTGTQPQPQPQPRSNRSDPAVFRPPGVAEHRRLFCRQ
jgi:hypothetical protein